MDQLVKLILSNPKADRLTVRIVVIWLVLLVAVQAKQGGM